MHYYTVKLRVSGEWTDYDVFLERSEAVEIRQVMIEYGENPENVVIEEEYR